ALQPRHDCERVQEPVARRHAANEPWPPPHALLPADRLSRNKAPTDCRSTPYADAPGREPRPSRAGTAEPAPCTRIHYGFDACPPGPFRDGGARRDRWARRGAKRAGPGSDDGALAEKAFPIRGTYLELEELTVAHHGERYFDAGGAEAPKVPEKIREAPGRKPAQCHDHVARRNAREISRAIAVHPRHEELRTVVVYQEPQ